MIGTAKDTRGSNDMDAIKVSTGTVGRRCVSPGRRLAAAAAMAVAIALVWAPSASAAFGDVYGAAPINGHADAIQQVPGIPGDDAFWAGACDLDSVGFGDLSGEGNGTGVGVRPSTVLGNRRATGLPQFIVPNDVQELVPAAALPEHCLDPGSASVYSARSLPTQGKVWQTLPYDTGVPHPDGGTVGQSGVSGDFAPRWRLPAATAAGAHPDGSSLLAWNRNKDGVGSSVGSVDGSVDNIYVDLPPGFVGNPQAVATCSNVEFREVPLRCPPESQVGILRLNLEGVCEGSSCNLFDTYDTTYPVYNLEPRKGKVAELGFAYAAGFAAIRLVADARTNGDFGVRAFTGQIPAALVPIAQEITLWGVPWAPENDVWRTKLGHMEGSQACKTTAGLVNSTAAEYIPPTGLSTGCQASYDPSWGDVKPFLTNETDCNPAPTVRLATDSFQKPGAFTGEGDPALPPFPGLLLGAAAGQSGWKTYSSVSPATTDCASLDFEPQLDLGPTSSAADSATGVRAKLDVPQNNLPRGGNGAVLDPEDSGYLETAADYFDSEQGRGTAHLKDTVVTLPPGLTLNPSAATGLEACSDAAIGLRKETDAATGRRLFNDGDPFNHDGGADGAECPEASKIGAAVVNTPLLSNPLEGEVVLGEPASIDPRSGEMFRLFIVVRDPDRGLIAKIYGSSTADGVVGGGGSGQIVTTFENNPEVPFDDLTLDIKGGDKGLLALPPKCGDAGWSSSMTPWSAAFGGGGASVDRTGSFPVDGRCAFGFGPGVEAGSSVQDARGRGAFSLRLTRPEGDQTIAGVSVRMPSGLLASLRGVPLCSAAAGDAGACGEGARIGSVDGAAGSGTPFVLEKKGSVYLTEGYKGGPYGLSIVVPVEAGPFRGSRALTTIVVRAAVQVDRSTADVKVVADPLPQVWHGIPLRVREILTTIDRPDFMLNPSDCSPKQVVADLVSPDGASASPTSPFQVTGCARLGFAPKLRLALTGRRQMTTGKHPGVRARVTQTGGEAGIERAEVRLPGSLALDPANAQALCEFADGTRDELEAHCPGGSIVGRATAVTPLLNRALTGNVYFVKNVERNPRTGALIRKLPMIVVALRGEIAINLVGKSSTTKNGRLVNTFSTVPDAPISQFELDIDGGENGILAVTRTRKSRINVCNSKQLASTLFDAHNGRDHDRSIRMTTPCKPKPKATCRTTAQKRTKACKRQAAKKKPKRSR